MIVRLPNWLGDTVMALPALRALREGRPEACILAAGPWVSLLAGQALADVLVAYPRSWAGRLRAADAVRGFRADTVIVLPASFEAALAARYWGARRRIGFAGEPRLGLLSERLAPPSPRRHQIDEYVMLVERVGVTAAALAPRLEPPAPDSAPRRQVRALLHEAGAPASGGRPLVGVHLGAAHGPAKVWPAERAIELCRLVGGAGATAVLLGAPGDVASAREVAAAAPAVSLVGRDAPELLPAVLTEIDVLVSGDTGVAHLAAALGTRVVTLFGPTDPDLTAPRGPAAVLRHPVPCAPCFYRRCPIEHPCMRGIAAAQVAEAALAGAAARAERS